MAEEKKKKEFIASPKGVAKFPHLTTPQTKFNPEGEYNVTLLFDPNDAAIIAYQQRIQGEHDAAFAAAKKADPKRKLTAMPIPIGDETTKDGAPTGKLAVKFKAKASGVYKKDGKPWTFKPVLKDRYGKPLSSDVVIYGGSIMQVSATVRHTAMPTGLFYTSLHLEAVLVHELKSGYERSAAEFGFDVEDETDAFGEQVPAGVAGEAGSTEGSSDF